MQEPRYKNDGPATLRGPPSKILWAFTTLTYKLGPSPLSLDLTYEGSYTAYMKGSAPTEVKSRISRIPYPLPQPSPPIHPSSRPFNLVASESKDLDIGPIVRQPWVGK